MEESTNDKIVLQNMKYWFYCLYHSSLLKVKIIKEYLSINIGIREQEFDKGTRFGTRFW